MINPHTLPKIEEIELWRKANGMTREQIASLLEVSHSMYEKWCSLKSNRVIPPYKQAEMKEHMSPPKEDLPDRISIGASWEEVQAWSKAFKQSPDDDLQSWMLNELNKAAHKWDAKKEFNSHRPASVHAPAQKESDGKSELNAG